MNTEITKAGKGEEIGHSVAYKIKTLHKVLTTHHKENVI